jgi:hypothetical protein
MANPIYSGAFVPTTNIWDVSQLYDVDVTSPAFKELLVRLYQNINNIAVVLNVKDTGYYLDQEFVNGQLYFPNPNYNSSTAEDPGFRQVWRLVINFGALPNTAAKTFAHGLTINGAVTFTRIYATASDTTGFNYIPIPYASASGTDNIQIDVNATDVTITTASDRTNFNICYIVLEYLTF